LTIGSFPDKNFLLGPLKQCALCGVGAVDADHLNHFIKKNKEKDKLVFKTYILLYKGDFNISTQLVLGG